MEGYAVTEKQLLRRKEKKRENWECRSEGRGAVKDE